MDDANLYQLAEQYVKIIEAIEETSDPMQLQQLEEQRVRLHGRLTALMKSQGIRFLDREHVTRIAFAIVRGKL